MATCEYASALLHLYSIEYNYFSEASALSFVRPLIEHPKRWFLEKVFPVFYSSLQKTFGLVLDRLNMDNLEDSEDIVWKCGF